MQFLQSDLVRVRRARWRVTDSRVYTHCQLLTLVGVDAFNARLERRILAPFDTVEHVERRPRPERISLRAWRRACRALIASESPPGGLRCARRARIELLPHQLEPALAIVRGLGSRVLLADAVGLGKTIQAGLIVSELRTLGAADRVLILTPAGLRDQWARELAERFDLHATILDARSVARSVATLPVGVNPWRMASVAIASIDYVKRPDVLTSVAACRSDVLIVDEAHGVAGDSDRHAAVAALASRSPFVVLLTATPHSGDRDAFRTLCRLGAVDAHAVDTHLWGPPSGGPIELKPDPTGQRPTTDDQLLVFRRTQADVRLGTARRIHRLLVRPSAAEARMHELLARFSLTVQREHGTTRPGSPANPGLWLALSVLHKRALSSAWSLQRSVERRLAALASADHDGGDHEGQLPLPFDEAAGEFSAADQPPPWSSALTLRDASHERQMLAELAAAATAAARRETKMGALGRLLRRIDEPAIVFTEYRDTLMHLRASIEGRASVLHGGLTRRERLEAIDEFTHGTSTVLLATDAAAEGLNLHHGCRSVINLELPWNPMRLEQRIGRVDRIGQTRTVHAFHLIAAGSSEPRILARLQRRLARAQADIGAPDPLGMDGSMDDEDAIARSIIEQSDVASAFRRTPDAEDVVRLK
ncbi:MAG: helicase-related protein, partial [Vicinamibacterales bacterium]